KAVQLGFISGKTAKNGSKFFDASGTLSRAQISKFLSIAYNLKSNGHYEFRDVKDKHWAKDFVDRIASEGITTGYPDNSFKPENNLQRQHFAVFMERLLYSNI